MKTSLWMQRAAVVLAWSEATCHDAGDADDSGVLELTDAVRILGYLFLGTAPPEAPGPLECGGDPTGEEPDLGCDAACP